MEQLTKNFNRAEFACKGKNCCGHSAPVDPVLVSGLQELHDLVGAPIRILSGFRCRTHNITISEIEDSYHTLGMAADIAADGFTGEQLAVLASRIPCFYQGGIGIYPNRIHVDVRAAQARWSKA